MLYSNKSIQVALTFLLMLLVFCDYSLAENKPACLNVYLAHNHSKSSDIDFDKLSKTIHKNKKIISSINNELTPQKTGANNNYHFQAKNIINTKMPSNIPTKDKDLPTEGIQATTTDSAKKLIHNFDTAQYIMPHPQDDKFIHKIAFVTTTKNDPKLDNDQNRSDSSENIYVLKGNSFKNNSTSSTTHPFYLTNKFENTTLFKAEVSKTENRYDEINIELPEFFPNDISSLNNALALADPTNKVKPIIFKEKKDTPFVNRLKTVYFLTALSTCIGQSTQIQDAFTTGHNLTGGGTSLNDYYGYENVVRNLLNPFSRAVKGAKVDDSGPIVNYIQHPFFGFGIASYLSASGASAKETILVTLADNFLFEYVVEGTYVAPSGIDFLSTSGGCIAGYFASKYLFRKPFQAFLKKTSALKAKYNVNFDPIIAPGYAGNGVKIGTKFTFKH